MKKFLSIMLFVFIFLTSVLNGSTVFAEEADYTVEKYNVAEITMISAKKYDRPYVDVEIDAVFTHEDGTQMKTPGFWKESNTWAVRFNPNKTGKWTYIITCSDTENEKLHNVSGTLLCVENDGSSEFEKHGFVKISDTNRYFTYDDGTPFFWLGDTNWQAPNYIQTTVCNYPGCRCGNQFKHEVDNRLSKGFNVYQTYFDSAESDGGGQRGKIAPIWTKKFTTPNTEVFNNKIDYMFKYLYDNGMVAALGFGVHKSTTDAIKEEDFLRFVRYVVARYSCYSIAWISGQEVTENAESALNPGRTALDMYMAASSLADELDCYDHPNGTHMYPLSTADSRVTKLDLAGWHQWWAVQAGHGATVKEKRFYQSYYVSANGNIKPYIEAEANYEDINCGGFTGYDANRYSAWNAIMNGACGFTYGVAGIWANCYSNEGNTGWFGPSSYNYEPWYMGLDKPGSYEVKYMKEFFERLPWEKLSPVFYNKMYGDFVGSEEKTMLMSSDMSTVVCYFRTLKNLETGTVKMLDNSKTYNTYWFNPITGKYIPSETVSGTKDYAIPQKPTAQDWVFLMTTEDLGELPFEKVYKDAEKAENIGNIVIPVEVTAPGGVYMKEGKKVDYTERLYDLKGDATWKPLADRVTQTIIYDLGTTYALTQVNIVPATGTVIPDYRIEGSLDGSSWTILANTTLRDKNMSEDGTYISEPVEGTYRFVKVLLLNAKDIPKDEVKSVKYLTTYNEKNTESYYSHTEIAEISVFSTGAMAVVPEGDEGTTDIENTENPENPENNITNDNGNDLTYILIFAGAGLCLGVVVGVVIGIILKKRKKN